MDNQLNAQCYKGTESYQLKNPICKFTEETFCQDWMDKLYTWSRSDDDLTGLDWLYSCDVMRQSREYHEQEIDRSLKRPREADDLDRKVKILRSDLSVLEITSDDTFHESHVVYADDTEKDNTVKFDCILTQAMYMAGIRVKSEDALYWDVKSLGVEDEEVTSLTTDGTQLSQSMADETDCSATSLSTLESDISFKDLLSPLCDFAELDPARDLSCLSNLDVAFRETTTDEMDNFSFGKEFQQEENCRAELLIPPPVLRSDTTFTEHPWIDNLSSAKVGVMEPYLSEIFA